MYVRIIYMYIYGCVCTYVYICIYIWMCIYMIYGGAGVRGGRCGGGGGGELGGSTSDSRFWGRPAFGRQHTGDVC